MSLSPDTLKTEFAVLYAANHAGTFNGVLETLHKSLEQWVDERMQRLVPGIILDYKTNMQKKLSFLRGHEARLWVGGTLMFLFNLTFLESGKEPVHVWRPAPIGGIFTADGAHFIQDFKDRRNEHTLYPLLSAFSAIKLSIGARVLVFNPQCPRRSLYIDQEDLPKVRDDAHLILVRAAVATDNIDMEECEQQFTDLFLECLTKKEFEEEYALNLSHSSRRA